MHLPPGLAPLRLGATQKKYPIQDGTSYRPGYHLTPAKLWSAYRQAELGAPAYQCDMFEDIQENDGSLRGQYESRLGSVALRPWLIQPGGKATRDIACAAALANALQYTNMPRLLWHLMDALGMGWSAANTAWGFDPATRVIAPIWFLLAPHRRFLIDDSGMGDLTFRTMENDWPGETLRPGEWIVAERFHRLIVRGGLFRTTSWWALFKRMSVADWIIFAEKFGIPFVMGQYSERASPESRAALLQAVTEIGNDGQAILSELTKIVINSDAMRQGDVTSLHPAIAARCDAEISKVITGATLNADSGGPGSFALGKVHEGRANSLVFGDAMWLQDVFLRAVIIPFVQYNPQFAGVALPSLYIRVRPEMAPDVAVTVYGKLQTMGLDIEDEQMREEFGVRAPQSGNVLVPRYAAPTATAPNPSNVKE